MLNDHWSPACEDKRRKEIPSPPVTEQLVAGNILLPPPTVAQ
jgi:hypothetical protein